MKILNLAPSNLCNISTNLSYGINEFSANTCRSVTLAPPPFGFDYDLLLKGNEKLVMQLIHECDLLHLNSWYFVNQKFFYKVLKYVPSFIVGGLSKFNDKVTWHYYRNYINTHVMGRKKIIVHYHGGDLRRRMGKADKDFINKKGFKTLVSVPDLLPQLENTQWLPIPVPTEDELYKPLPKRDNSVMKIVHSPTEREAKKTAVLIKAVEALKHKYDVELLLIENMPYKECLKLKKTAHIAFDNIEFGSYAGCSVEAMCHEQPALVYLNDISLQQINEVSEEIGIDSPFVNIGDRDQPSIEYLNKVIAEKARNIITEDDYRSVYDNLERLIVDSNLRKELGKRGRKWASRVHDLKVVVKKLIDIYES